MQDAHRATTRVVFLARFLAFVSLETVIQPRVAAPPRDARRLQAPSAPSRFVIHPIALLEGLVRATGYGRATYEEIFASLIRTDKTVAALIAEPFDRSLGHGAEPSFFSSGSIAIKKPPLFWAALRSLKTHLCTYRTIP